MPCLKKINLLAIKRKKKIADIEQESHTKGKRSNLSGHFSDTYNNIFVDSGRSPDSYLNSDLGGYLNDSSLFNGTFDVNGTTISVAADKNYTAANNEDVAELVVMAVTSIVLGLMILITVIGLYRQLMPGKLFQ